MTRTVDIRRKNAWNLIRDRAKFSNFDEYPVLKEDVDPQLHVSVNSVDQPFYVIFEKDNVLAAMSGSARVHFKGASVHYFDLRPGDHVYVPGGIPHRIVGGSNALHLRYKARQAGLEAVAWYCDRCGDELDRCVWDTARQVAQAGYHAAVTRFNAATERRTCESCGHEHPVIDLAPFRWEAVAASLA